MGRAPNPSQVPPVEGTTKAARETTARRNQERLETMSSGIWKEMMRRRVPHILGAYLATGWILLEFTDWSVDHWVLSSHITDFVVTSWAFMIPAVVLIAWTHGAPGRDRWTRLEMGGVLLNMGVAAALIFGMFRGRDLGAATNPVTVQDEEGNSVERAVPKREFMQRVALFAFQNQSGLPELDWLQFGLPWSMAIDLEQDNWLRTVTGFQEESTGEGFSSPSHLPLARQREIARERFLDYLLSGTVEAGEAEGEVALTTRLYEAATGAVVAERRFAGADLLDLADRASIALRRDLEVPTGHIEQTPDLPVRELLSDSLVAVQAYLQAVFAQDRDAAANLRLLSAATAVDSTFALAQASLGEGYIAFNQPEQAYAAYETALRHEYRLSERSRFEVKVRYYQITRQPEKALAIARMRTELYPDDPTAWDVLGVVLSTRGDYPAAIRAFETGRSLDPSSWGRTQALAQSYLNEGRSEDARRAYQSHADRYPERLAPIRALGTLHLQQGDFETAASYFEKALLVNPNDYPSLVAMADISERTAEFAEARRFYDRAISASGDTDAMWSVGARLVGYFDLQGMTDSAIARLEAVTGYLGRSQGRLSELQLKVNSIALYPRAGRTRRAWAVLDTLRAELEPPLTSFIPIGEALLYRELGDGPALEAKIPEARRLYAEFGFEALDWIMVYLEAEAQRLQGRCTQAIPLYERATTGMQSGVVGETDVSLGGNPWVGLGECYREVGRHADAATALGQAYVRLPADPRNLYQMALLYRDMGDRAEAMRYLNGAVHVWQNADPDHAQANEARALLAAWEGRR